MRYDLVAGDLEPAIQAKLSNPSGQTLPAGSTVEFAMLQADGAKQVVGLGAFDDLSIPSVHYAWQPGDTDVPGVYRAQWRIRLGSASGDPETWPSDETFFVVIHPSLVNPIPEAVVSDRVRVQIQ